MSHGAKNSCLAIFLFFPVFLAINCNATVLYVNLSSTNPISPYANWGTAAINIQDAVDAANPGDQILVTNGNYQIGGKPAPDGTSTRLVATNALIISSVNGPAVTSIDGGSTMRCVYLADGAFICGFTVTRGSIQSGNSSQFNGAGICCTSVNTTISNCVIVANSTAGFGGGAYWGTIINSVLSSNTAGVVGGGTLFSDLRNCALIGNTGGGAHSGTLNNCTIVGNLGGASATLNNCIFYNNPGVNSQTALNNCWTNDPQMADFIHISANSPCRGAGNPAYVSGVDIDGDPWSNPPSIGCDEYQDANIIGPLSVSLQSNFTNFASGFTVHFASSISGHATSNTWNFNDGTILNNELYASHQWQNSGDYPVRLTVYNDTFPAGVTATVVVHVASEQHFVNLNNTAPIAPYTSWGTAATNIQDAVDSSVFPGATVLVTNGIYQTGGRIVYGALSNRVAVTKPLILQSVNGPSVTFIVGHQIPGAIFGDSAMRGVYLTNYSILAGFTVTNGATRAAGDLIHEQSGGGVFCESSDSVVVSNCVVSGNAAHGAPPQYDLTGIGGGGIINGTLNSCWLIGNAATNGYGGGASQSTLNNCILAHNSAGNGGGAYQSALNNCWITNNSAGAGGGSGYNSTLINCVLAGNVANVGGGAIDSTLLSCTVVSNYAAQSGGGSWNCGAQSSIIYYNTAPRQPNYDGGGVAFCCTTPVYSDYGAFGDPPQFVNFAAGDYHLQSNSPCVNAGYPYPGVQSADLDGNPRIIAGIIDVGAYELQSASPPSIVLQADYTTLVTNFAASFKVFFNSGHAVTATWNFGDGTIVSNTLTPMHAWVSPGDYSVMVQAFSGSDTVGLTASLAIHVYSQVTYYVNASATNPTAPYISWATAATNIQDAVDASVPVPSSLVMVNDGVYQYGGRAVYGAMTNRVAVSKPLTIRSVNGPQSTLIQGYNTMNVLFGDSSVRCVYLTNGAALIGFTLTGGSTRIAGDGNNEQSGGGVWCPSTNALIVNCLIKSNSAALYGGGGYGGTYIGCDFSQNQAAAAYGGGAYSGNLNNCTITRNNAKLAGGGAYQCNLNNSIVYYNSAPSGSNYSGGVLNYCCTQPPSSGTANITNAPRITDDTHIAAGSPCRGMGNVAYISGTDIDGQAWLSPPSIGCDEYYPSGLNGLLSLSLQADYTNISTGFVINLTGFISGSAAFSYWDFGDGTTVSNLLIVSHAWPTAGDFAVKLFAVNDSYPAGVNATIVVHVLSQPIHYVSLTSTNPSPPYFSWDTAAVSIQDAVDAAYAGGTVMVSNGVYQTGGRIIYGSMSNRVAVYKPLTVQSVNGASSTIIMGNPVLGDGAVRCISLANATVLAGFTLTGGATRNAGDSVQERSGGGVWCASTNSALINCILISNVASVEGGGIYLGVCSNCTLAANSCPSGGGAYGGSLFNCTVTGNTNASSGGGMLGCFAAGCLISSNFATTGGGVYSSTLTNCMLMNNFAGFQAAAAYNSTLNDSMIIGNITISGMAGGGKGCIYNTCLICSNSASSIISGVANGSLINCTIVGQTSGYATYSCTLKNCISYYNASNYFGGTFANCCTTPLPAGSGNFTNSPLFLNVATGDFHLRSDSPCINAGNNLYVTNTTDVDGNPRIQGGSVDLGAYELQSPTSVVSYQWLQQYGLATDGSADFNDSDGDGMNNWQEWRSGTDPTNAASVLKMLGVSSNAQGLIVSWQSVSGRNYYVQRSSNLSVLGSFATLQSNILGKAGTMSYSDNTATNGGPYYYRVGVK